MADPTFQFFKRFAAKRVATALADTPVVMLIGPRQCGKTTLVRQFGEKEREYVTLDDDTVLEAARNDPAGFVRGFDLVTIDEVQRAPELLRAIKRSVDSDRRAGRFLLTGSANILTLPQVSESLAGRMEIVNLMPISRAEILGKEPTFLKMAFNSKLVKPGPEIVGDQLVHAVLIGGYPEMLRREDSRRRQAWARDYVKAIVHRDAAERRLSATSSLGTRLCESDRTERCAGYRGSREARSVATFTSGAFPSVWTTDQLHSNRRTDRDGR